MSGRLPIDDRRPMAEPPAAGGQGAHVGPVRVTPTRVTLLIAFVGGLGFLAWSIFVRDNLQVPLMASGFAIVGLVFAAMAAMSAAGVVRAGRDGRDGTAVLMALVGGVLAIGAFLSFAAAVIMGLIWGGTNTS